jgi:diguanylate cyclase (GGDEF)-like protein
MPTPAPRAVPKPAYGWRYLLWLGLLLSCGVLLAPTQARAEDRIPALHELAQRTWTTREGLPHNSVNALAQTADGYLWLATWEGLARYNGREFELFTREQLPPLEDVAMRSLHVDHEGGLWVGGVRGDLLRFHRGTWSRLPPAPAFVNALLLDRAGRLWVGQESQGLLRIDPDGSRHAYGRAQGMLGDSVFELVMDPEGRVFAGTSGGLVRIEGEHAIEVRYSEEGGNPAVLGLNLDRSGRLLLSTARGAFRTRSADYAEGFESLHPQLAGRSVFRMVEGKEGALWIGTAIEGLARLQGDRLETLGTAEGLPSGRVLSLLLDQDEALWIATNGGLMRLGAAPFSTFTDAQGLSENFVRAVMRSRDGSLWIGTGRGLNRVVEGRVVALEDARLREVSVLSLTEAVDGSLLVGSFDRGVLRVRDGQVVEHIDRSQGLPSDQIRALRVARDGALWIGTIAGLAVLDPGAERARTLAPGPSGAFVNALGEDAEGRIWLGTTQGLDRVEDGERIVAGPQLPADARAVFAITRDGDGRALWVSTDRGLMRLQPGTGAIALIGREQGLPMEKVFNALADGAGHLWLSTNRGALRLQREDALAVIRGQTPRIAVDVFDESHGMASSQCNTGSPAADLDAEGNVWIATAIGAVRIRRERLDEDTARPLPTVLEHASAEGRVLPLDRPAVLPAGTSRVAFSVAGLGFVMPERIHYRYRLEGFDTDWVERGRLHAVEYTNLPPGRYRLRAQAAYAGSAWDSPEAQFEFEILPAPWERPWVQALAALGFFVIAMMLYRLRVRALRARAEGLERAVERKTAELRASTDRLLAADAEKTALMEQLRVQAEAFERQAREDALTGLANRRAFDETVAREFRRARRTGTPLCLAMLDIDHFKRINDSFSHAAGDEVIVRLAQLMRGQCRDIDVLARWGGEEFALLMPQTRLEDAARVCERLREAFAQEPFDSLQAGLRITVSIGLASEEGLESHEALLVRADAALYRAKRGGRNQVVLSLLD